MKIILKGNPIPKARARYSKRGSFVVTYDPQEKEKNKVKEQLTFTLADQINSDDKRISTEACKVCLGKAFTVSFVFYLPINKSDSIGERNAKLWGLTLATNKPDFDNLAKFYCDCLNNVIWADDCLVVRGEIDKFYSDDPRVEIEIKVKEVPKLSEKEKKIITMFSPDELYDLLANTSALSSLKHGVIFDLCDESKHAWFKEVSHRLSDFSLKYTSILKKIEKLGCVREESLLCQELIKEIDEGKHAV
jgi:Holliday junction resolvase RusA-like endonuclease